MNDPADFRFDNGATIVDHLVTRGVSGGLFNGVSDGAAVAMSGSVPVGDPQLYLLSGNSVIDTSKYRYLTSDFRWTAHSTWSGARSPGCSGAPQPALALRIS